MDFIADVQLAQYLDLYKLSKEDFQKKCDFWEADGKNYIKTFLGIRADIIKEEEMSQLIKYFVWWRIYADLNLSEGEHYKKNFDTLIKGFQNNSDSPRQTTKGIMVF